MSQPDPIIDRIHRLSKHMPWRCSTCEFWQPTTEHDWSGEEKRVNESGCPLDECMAVAINPESFACTDHSALQALFDEEAHENSKDQN